MTQIQGYEAQMTVAGMKGKIKKPIFVDEDRKIWALNPDGTFDQLTGSFEIKESK